MYTILVVDDEKDIVSALEIYLTAEGYRVLTAYNGREALSVAAREDIHLILMDIMMPVMDGLTAMAQLRQTVDRLECIVDKAYWLLPSYGELLFHIAE